MAYDSLLNSFLVDSVFYPASGSDGAPVKYLSKRYSRFVYADYSIERDKLLDTVNNRGFRDYRVGSTSDLSPEFVLGSSWNDIWCRYSNIIEHLHFPFQHPYIILFELERVERCPERGPNRFHLLFLRCEGVITYRELYAKRSIAPSCLSYIRTGIGFGGNYSKFPAFLSEAMGENAAGLPHYILHDDLCTRGAGDWLPTVESYRIEHAWRYRTEDYGDGRLSLGHLPDVAELGASRRPNYR